VGGLQPLITCQIGINQGAAFVAEVGEPRGRREFNVLGDTVNTTARLMNKAGRNQIIISEKVHNALGASFETTSLGTVPLKGRDAELAIFELVKHNDRL
jgi:class 3 adenylate cyclase